MDQESLAQIKHIVTGATEALEGRLRQEIQQTEGRLRQEIQQTEGRLRQEIQQTEGQLRQEIQQTEGRLREETEDVKRHTGVLAEHLEHKISLLVEGQQAVRQYMEDFRSETQSETKETRALLRLS
ncbi:MAG: hypothetical protein P0120_07850 [Nitrospira sp.]|nr:hypothetical protein [Nitrospira sp.]